MVKVVARLTPNTIVVVFWIYLRDCCTVRRTVRLCLHFGRNANTELYFLISLMYKAHMYRFPSGTRSGFNVGKLYCKS
jgi:hypothetical protein